MPRVPVADNTAQAEDLIYRNLWKHIRKDLPKGTRRKEDEGGDPSLPKELQGALHSLYSHYEKTYNLWEEARMSGATDTHAAGVYHRLQQYAHIQNPVRLRGRL